VLQSAGAPAATAESASIPRPTPRPTIAGAIERYRSAVESGELSQIVAAYPAMRAVQVASYTEFFRTADRIRFEVVSKDLIERNGEARLRLEGFMRDRDRHSGQDQITHYSTHVRLVDGPTGWRIVEIR
jgi:hypothetical protein